MRMQHPNTFPKLWTSSRRAVSTWSAGICTVTFSKGRRWWSDCTGGTSRSCNPSRDVFQDVPRVEQVDLSPPACRRLLGGADEIHSHRQFSKFEVVMKCWSCNQSLSAARSSPGWPTLTTSENKEEGPRFSKWFSSTFHFQPLNILSQIITVEEGEILYLRTDLFTGEAFRINFCIHLLYAF